MSEKKRIDMVLFYVVDKKRNKVKDIEIALGNDDTSKMEAFMKLKKNRTDIKSDDVVMSMEVTDVMEGLPLFTNHTI